MKNSNELEELLDFIQKSTGETLDEIGRTIGKTRPYISKLKKEGGANAVSLAETIKIKYAKVLKDKVQDTNKIKALDAAVSVLIAEVASLRSERTGEPIQSEIMRLRKACQDAEKLG